MAHEQLTFPWLTDDPRRMMPTEFIGAAVFSALNRSARPINNDRMTVIARMNGYRLTHKGRVLTQAHADVWMGIIEIFRRNDVAADCGVEFTSRQLLKILGKASNSKSRDDLREWISDMVLCAVSIFAPGQRRAFFGPLVFGEVPDKGVDAPYRLMLHPDVCRAFRRAFTGVRWGNRRSLGKNELALWMHQYVVAFPGPVPIGMLQQLSWQTKADPRKFRHRVRAALDLMVECGIIAGYDIDAEHRLHPRLPQARPALAQGGKLPAG